MSSPIPTQPEEEYGNTNLPEADSDDMVAQVLEIEGEEPEEI